MKKLLTALLTIATLSLFAADKPFYKANEFDIGAFGGLISQDLNTEKSGAGIDAAYFPTINWGLRAETFTLNLAHSTVDQVTGLLVYRIPIKKSCPYFFAGGGRDLENWEWNLHFGGGIEHRLTKNFGIFTDVRMVKEMGDCPQSPAAMIRAGIRFAF